MTQAPVLPRHKDEAAKVVGYSSYEDADVDVSGGDLMYSIAAHAQTLANLEAARADLAEIDGIAVTNNWSFVSYSDDIHAVAAIAAPYRASDPVAEALSSIMGTLGIGTTPTGGKWEDDPDWPAALAKFRAFIERTEDGNG